MPTNASMTAPTCLHVSDVQNGLTSQLHWEQNAGYELDWILARQSSAVAMTWRFLQAAATTWRLLTNKRTTWRGLHGSAAPQWQPLYRGSGQPSDLALPNCPLEHIFHEAEIPDDAITVQFRVRSYCGGVYTPYIASQLYSLNDDIDPTELGQTVFAQIKVSQLKNDDYEKRLTVHYQPGELRCIDIATCPGVEAAILSGAIEITLSKDVPANMEWSGTAALISFESLIDGDSAVTITHMEGESV